MKNTMSSFLMSNSTEILPGSDHCKLVDGFAIFVQLVLATIAFGSLICKKKKITVLFLFLKKKSFYYTCMNFYKRKPKKEYISNSILCIISFLFLQFISQKTS